MSKKDKMCITMSADTKKNLQKIQDRYGLTKSQAIAYAVNSYGYTFNFDNNNKQREEKVTW